MMSVWGGSGGGGNPMHRTHRIWMMAIGWVAVKIFWTSGVYAGVGADDDNLSVSESTPLLYSSTHLFHSCACVA